MSNIQLFKFSFPAQSWTMQSPSWRNDGELFQMMRSQLYTAVVGDILDSNGHLNQFLPPTIRPLREDMVVAGRAMPVLQMDDAGGEGPGRQATMLNQPFGLMLRALDDLKSNDVYVCSGSSPQYALWGELMSMAARNRGAAGAVVNGFSRDTPGIIKLNFPTFSSGFYARDQRARGKVVDYRCQIKVGDVTVKPGDIIFGDIDGVVVVPAELEQDVISLAWEKAHGEKRVFEAIQNGMGAQEAWDKFGIL
jgi:regulator of RNase E activity RraA